MLRRDLIEDGRLSFRALGLLTYILDKPDNWRIDAVELAKTHKEGRDAVYAALTELEEAGYLTRAKSQDARGRWSTSSVVNESPTTPAAEAPREEVEATDHWETGAGKPAAGSPVTITSTETSTENETDARFARVAAPDACASKDALYAAVCRVCCMEYAQMTDPERKRTGVAVAQIMKVGATVEQVERRAEVYLQRNSSMLTPTALAGQWSRLHDDAPMAQTAPRQSAVNAGIEKARAARRGNVVRLRPEPDALLERNTS